MLQTFRTRHGVLAHFSHDTTIRLSLSEYGEWAEEEIYLLSQCVHYGDTVLDIGANIGTHSLALRRFVGDAGRVVAMDAQHRIFQILCLNMAINGFPDVDCLNVLVGSKVGIGMIANATAEDVINFGAARFASDDLQTEPPAQPWPVAMITVDSLNLSRVAAIKVDVEGMELDVFKGAEETITRSQPLIYFEQTGPRNLEEIRKYLMDKNYTLFWHVGNPYNAHNFNANPVNVFGGTCEVNIVAVPEARRELVERLGLRNRVAEPAIYNPEIPKDALKGWSLPNEAYASLQPARLIALPYIKLADSAEPSAPGDAAFLQLQAQYAAMVEDRRKAQVIMEFQKAEIERLKSVDSLSP